MKISQLLLVLPTTLLGSLLHAADITLPKDAKIERLSAFPPKIELAGPYAYTQLVVTAHLADGSDVDVTRTDGSRECDVATMSKTGLVRPARDGAGQILYRVGGVSLSIPVSVSGAKAEKPISFVSDVQPVLSKLGCTAGTCHGSAKGKNGFKLSLRGYDPVLDHRALTDDLESRRFNRVAPERSLMLLKTSGAIPHTGGVLTSPGEPYYEMLKTWIAQGAKGDVTTPKVKSIAVFPKNPTLGRIGQTQQFAVVATYHDGHTRDVTAESFLDSSNTEIATVDKTGLVTTVRRGEATILVRYDGAYAASTMIVTGDRTGFAWEDRPAYNWIDELVDKKLKAVKIQPSPICNDAEFLRRVYLDLTGLPPSADEVRAFLADPTPMRAKRDAVIDRLVGSKAYIEQWTNKWADMLQVNRKFLGQQGAVALRKWIKNAVATNMPYDQFAYKVLTASGSNLADPPAAYFKVLRTPDEVMENTTQLFLAVRFNCNKCHDHPFEKWTQDQYYSLAAFFARVDRKEDPKFKGQKIGGTNVDKPVPLVEDISDGPRGEETHIRTGKVAPPEFPFSVPELAKPGDLPRRVQVAKWITSPKNPYFAKSYANRIWSYLTGTGVIEPVDDIRAGNPPTNPELLDRLTSEFVSSGFDVQKLVKTICKSRTYQLSVGTNKWNKDDEINYSHALARRLPAEVLYDTVYKTTGSISHLPGLPPGSRAAQLVDSNVELPGGFLDLLGKPVRESACECERSNGMMLGPVLAMVSGPVIGDAIQDSTNHIARFTEKEKNDSKVVDEIYLSILNRPPTATERKEGVAALEAAGKDQAALMDDFRKKKAAFDAYAKTLDAKQIRYEAMLHDQKPTHWTVLDPMSVASKAGPTIAAAKKDGSTLKIQADKSILVSGRKETVDVYTVTSEVQFDGKITAVRLEALTDPSLPAHGPGRAPNGNFVLNEFKITAKPLKGTAKPKALKLVKPQATIQQDGFPAGNAVDNNPATGWAISNGVGTNQAAAYEIQGGLNAKDGVLLTFTLDQRYGTGHTLGKFRLSVSTEKKLQLSSPISPALLRLLNTIPEARTTAEKTDLRNRYLAQDKEYQNLKSEADKVPPSDPRVLGAQDLTWALINSPAFLFNR
ncbi:MAG TPA: DUF1549 domain-containing protein [Fimbriiglobus sp.]|jgi:hypothetical protein